MANTLTKAIRVLVVEDDFNLLNGIRDILRYESYEVLTAQNGREALDILETSWETPPDLIVSDIMMPHMDGFQLLEQVRKVDAWVTIPFIFLTAKSEKVDQHRGRRMGADVYMTKPFEPTEFLVQVEATISRLQSIHRAKESEVSDIKRRILTILNHEFRTPLTQVAGFSEMLRDFGGIEGGLSAEEMTMFLKNISTGADRLRRLVENFLILVELDNGDVAKTISWRKRPITNLRQVAEDAFRQVAYTFNDPTPHDFNLQVQEGLPAITADIQYVTIVLRELLANGAKFSPDHTSVSLYITAREGGVEMSISDQGRGIPASEQDNIWLPFYQIDRDKYEDQGAGSGLAIVEGIVRLHGGWKRLDSRIGEGSLFTVWLPPVPPN